MTRRDALSAIGVVAVTPLLSIDTYEPVGFMDFERWWAEGRNEAGYSVLLDGVDITDGCVWFNDITGDAYCYRRNSGGKHYVVMGDHGQEIAGRLMAGVVRVVKP